jgi:hypothetical protein
VPIYGPPPTASTSSAFTGTPTMDPLTLALIMGGMQLGGGILSGMGQGAAQDKQNALTREQLAVQQRQFNAQHEQQQGNFQTAQGLMASQQNPLAQQEARQRQAMLAAVMPGLRNVQVSSDIPGMNRFIPQVSGGMRLPEGGFGQDTLAFFSPEARAAAEGQYAKATAPVISPPDLSKVGYGPAGVGVNDPAQQIHTDALARNKAILASLGQTVNSPSPRQKRTGDVTTGTAVPNIIGRPRQ